MLNYTVDVSSLGLMSVDFRRDLPQEVQVALFSRLSELEQEEYEINGQGVASIILGLGKMGAPFDAIAETGRATLLKIIVSKGKEMNGQGVAIAIYG